MTPSPPPAVGEIFTLEEAAAYLRVSEEDLLAAVRRQQLPGRQIREEWRFLKPAIDDWLRSPAGQRERILRIAGAWKDDPYLDEMLEAIYPERGRPIDEEPA